MNSGLARASGQPGTRLAPDEFHLVVHVWIRDENGKYLISRELRILNPTRGSGQRRRLCAAGEDSLTGHSRDARGAWNPVVANAPRTIGRLKMEQRVEDLCCKSFKKLDRHADVGAQVTTWKWAFKAELEQMQAGQLFRVQLPRQHTGVDASGLYKGGKMIVEYGMAGQKRESRCLRITSQRGNLCRHPKQADRRFSGNPALPANLGAEVEFITIMWFDSLDAVRAFAGEDYQAAVVPPGPELCSLGLTSVHSTMRSEPK